MEIFQFNRTRFIKNIDPKTFPLCRKVLLEIIKRAWYIPNYIKQQQPLTEQSNWQKSITGGNYQMIMSSWTLSDMKGSMF